MREEDHLPKANHLRLSVGIWVVVILAGCCFGTWKFLEWNAQQNFKIEQEKNRAHFERRRSGEEMMEETRAALKPKVLATRHLNPTSSAEPTQPSPKPVAENSAWAAPISLPATIESSANENETGSSSGVPIAGNVQRGTIFGRVMLEGAPPPEKVIEPLLNDPTCGKAWTNGPPKTRFFMVSSRGGLANTLVRIHASATEDGSSQKPAWLVQSNCLFEPYVMAIMVDQPLKIVNADSVLHNVHMVSTNNREFNFAQPVQGQTNEKSFTKPETFVRIKCDVHPWMFAYIAVEPTHFYAITDETGSFAIHNVPQGTYTVEAVHPKIRSVLQHISTGKSGFGEVNFKLRAPSQ